MRAKFFYNWTYTRVRGVLLQTEINGICVLYGLVRENQLHCLECIKSRVIEHCAKALLELIARLNELKTHPTLVDIIYRKTQFSMPSLQDERFRAQLHKMETRQELLGWD